MKKLAIGCAGIIVLLTIVGAGLAYWFVYRPAKSYVSSMAQLQEIPKLHQQVRNKASFTPPADGELTQALLRRYIDAQDALHQRLGARLDELDRKYKALEEANGGNPSLGEAMAALRDLGDLILEAKRAQVDALNQHDFSLAEYEWVRGAAYSALGVPFHEGISEFIESAAGGAVPFGPAAHDGDSPVVKVPARNGELVAPYAEKLRERAALAFFGL